MSCVVSELLAQCVSHATYASPFAQRKRTEGQINHVCANKRHDETIITWRTYCCVRSTLLPANGVRHNKAPATWPSACECEVLRCQGNILAATGNGLCPVCEVSGLLFCPPPVGTTHRPSAHGRANRSCNNLFIYLHVDWIARKSDVVVEFLTLLLRIRKVSGSNLGTETGYPDWCFRDFSQSLRANMG
jgi:hypothetical protein